jgi:hypothetical protein
MNALADITLPEGTVLTEGNHYGLRVPEFAGDPCTIHPYALIQHDRPEGYVYILATGETTFEVLSQKPERAGDLEAINGLLPMASPRDTDTADRPRRQRMLSRSASKPQEVSVTQGPEHNPVAPALSAPSKGKGKGGKAPATSATAPDPLAGLAPPPA